MDKCEDVSRMSSSSGEEVGLYMNWQEEEEEEKKICNKMMMTKIKR